MEMAVAQPCPCSSFIFFTRRNTTRLHNFIHFPFYEALSHPHLRRRFSSYAAGDGSNSRRRRSSNRWDSNAETIRAKGFSFNTQNYDDDDEEQDDDDDYEEMGSSGILEEAIDSIWIFKVFKSYGWTLPPILFSLFFASGPKAFLMALALPVGQSVITFAFGKLLGKSQSKKKRKAKVRKKRKKAFRSSVKNVKIEKEVQESQRNRKGTKDYQSQRNRKGAKDYQSWVVDDNCSINDGGNGATSFGGWDELDEMGSMRMSSTMSSSSKRTPEEKNKLSMEGSKSNEPLLLRLLIAVFPFLSSWTKLFW